MPEDDRIADLMIRWEEARQRGVRLTAQKLCANDPHLVDLVSQRIQSVLAMELVLGIDEQGSERTVVSGLKNTSHDRLPDIPGYVILNIVDEGGMGVVYRARQKNLGRIVAVKTISGIRTLPKNVARFQTEAEATARLQHPNIVQIFDIGQIDGRPFFSMEFVNGGTLAQLIKRKRPSPSEAAVLVETLARAVHSAHERGIVHRDLKPSNVMLTAEGIPKITDFGLAKRFNEQSNHTQTGEILGTPSYMAPEQAKGNKDHIGPLTDVYALGAVLYELLTGRPPFCAGTPLDTIMQVASQEVKPPALIEPKTPKDLETICLKCLGKTPSDRYASAHELANDLRRFINGESVSARRIGPFRRCWKWVKRHPQGTVAGVTLFLLILIPLLLVVAHYRERRRVFHRAQEVAPQVREILKRNCFECHGSDPKNIEKNLNILDYQLLRSSDRNYIVVGSPYESRLIQRIADGSMPPETEEITLPRVTQKELDILEDWIRGDAPPFSAQDPAKATTPVVPYSPLATKVKSIFVQNCYECHKFDVAKGGIKILHHRLLLHVRKVIVPGKPDESELFKLITTDDPKLRMPPIEYEPLTPANIATIRRWIEEGAPAFTKTQ